MNFWTLATSQAFTTSGFYAESLDKRIYSITMYGTCAAGRFNQCVPGWSTFLYLFASETASSTRERVARKGFPLFWSVSILWDFESRWPSVLQKTLEQIWHVRLGQRYSRDGDSHCFSPQSLDYLEVRSMEYLRSFKEICATSEHLLPRPRWRRHRWFFAKRIFT